MLSPQTLKWKSVRPVAIDFGGPVNVPFETFDAGRAGIARFDLMAERFAGKVAVDDGDLRLTYRQVQRAVHALMGQLGELPPGRPVVALLRNTARFPIVFLAHLGAGRALVPVDGGDPPERQAAIMRETVPAAILLGDGVTLAEGVFDSAVPRLRMDPDAAEPISLPDFNVQLQDAAGVAYTSGSTGRPKGLAFSQRQFLTGTAEYVDSCHINAEDRILCLASLSGAGCRDALVALFTGATLHIVNIKASGVGAVIRALEAGRVTVLSFVPSVLRVLARLDGAAAAFQHLRILDLFGDRTSAADIALFRRVLPPDCKIRLSLASTEAATMFHWFVRPEALRDGQTVPCGYLARGVSIALLNEPGVNEPGMNDTGLNDAGPNRAGVNDAAPNDARVNEAAVNDPGVNEPGVKQTDDLAADGEIGELMVRGDNLALGAWQDGRQAPGPFLTDPDNPQFRVFNTGDMIRMRSDGLAEFAGRRDRRVKIRGMRADPAELEDALRMLPGITDVAVAVRSEGDEAILIAYAVAENPAADPGGIRTALAAMLPAHLVPARIELLPTIPRLANFKPDLVVLDRRTN